MKMVDIGKFKQDFIKLLNSNKESIIDPLLRIYTQFLINNCATEVDFSSFSFKNALEAYDQLYQYATEEDFYDGYNEDESTNEGNLFHEFCKIDQLCWGELLSLPAKMVDDYI
jgi:hypothetical protein